MFLGFENTKIFFTAKGAGKPLVLLHGFLESSLIWEPYLDDLTRVRQVICIDLPGHGQSGTIGSIHSMELMADIVKAVLDHLKIPKATFAGHSMGGYVALSYLEKFPENVLAILLINSTPEKDSDERIANRDRAIELIKKNKRAFVSMAISNLLGPESNGTFKSEIAVIRKQALKFSTEGITACIEGMKIRTEKKELLKNYQNRKIFLVGKTDPILHWKTASNIADYCNCETILVNGGHLAYIENPAEVREILHFID